MTIREIKEFSENPHNWRPAWGIGNVKIERLDFYGLEFHKILIDETYKDGFESIKKESDVYTHGYRMLALYQVMRGIGLFEYHHISKMDMRELMKKQDALLNRP